MESSSKSSQAVDSDGMPIGLPSKTEAAWGNISESQVV